MVKEINKSKDIDPDYVRMYFDHQYDRIKKHEDQALNISNIVLTISALIITFGLNNRQSFGSIFILFLPVIIIIANLFAIFYIRDSGNWIRSHRLRAKRILETYVPELFVLDNETIAPHKQQTVGRRRFQRLVHILFIVIAVILLLLFTLELFGVSLI
ncbi:MAG: hypothetical protein KKD28_11285 [Chloroflexi bacterium]|nr:hypothetical protein [Chloroflexota bacterium]